ncbi:MAG: LPS assembly lipoprotein LptE [Pseudomonadota bacterium]
MRVQTMRQILRGTIASIAISALAACSVQPLYSTSPSTGEITGLSIPLENPSDRTDQLVRNALLDLIGRDEGSNGYSGAINASVRTQSVFRSDAPDSVTAIRNQRVTVTAVLVITNENSGEEAARFTGVGRTFYESSRQQFANDRSEIDAEQRAASEAAEALRNQLAVFLKQNPIAPDALDAS